MPDFFEEIDGMSILERNAARIEGVELRQAQRLIKVYKQAREEIKLQLLAAPDNSFTEAKLQNALAQIDQGLRLLRRRILGELAFGQETATEQGAEDAAREMNAFEKAFAGVATPIPLDEIITSVEPENFLFNNYQSSVDRYEAGLRSNFENALTQSLLQRKSWSQAVYDMEQVFDGQTWELARIVRTELHNIYNVSKNRGFENIQANYLPDLKKTLYHPMDGRTGQDSKTAAAKNLIVALDEPFRYDFKQGNKTIERVFFVPPDRPNDRSILIPYRDSYDRR